MLEIGGWVLDTACRQLAIWAKNVQTRDLVLAINVSAQQFKHHDFVSQIETVLRVHAVEASRLKLELTESVVLNNVTDVITKMHALKALGVGLSLDDFGTGYSSLSYLKQLPLDQLKIDQSFVRDMTTDQNDAVMVQTIINLAQNFRLNVIAEGVETEAQQTALKLSGCNAYQGYFFSKPVPIELFEKLLKTIGNVAYPVDHSATRLLRLNWQESYNCGEATIDQDHRQLFDLANTVIDASFARKDKPLEFDAAMDKLLTHVAQHFADEEAILAEHHYIDLASHARAHRGLIEHALQLRDNAAKGNITIGELVDFLVGEVIVQHILKTDSKFYPLLLANRTVAQPENG